MFKPGQIVRQPEEGHWYLERSSGSSGSGETFPGGTLWKVLESGDPEYGINVKNLLDDTKIAKGCPPAYFEEL